MRANNIFFVLTITILFTLNQNQIFSQKSSESLEKKPDHNSQLVNSIGMKMILIPAGKFKMGATEKEFSLVKKDDMSKDAPYYDETPVHEVSITNPFYISETEITIDQYKQFQKDYYGSYTYEPYASGINWNDADAFCKWLSEKEGKTYRLPTEAEWEYACRAGTETLFWSGVKPPEVDTNPFGLKNMHTAVPEWCDDWYGEYQYTFQTDPVGYDKSWAKVIRGGALMTEIIENKKLVPEDEEGDEDSDFKLINPIVFQRSANRCSLMPNCPAKGDSNTTPHFIGIRLVQAELPSTTPVKYELSFPLQGIKQSEEFEKYGPEMNKPYFKARQIVAIPPDLNREKEIEIVGLDRANLGKLHSAGFTVCPNGDILSISFSSAYSKSEAAPNTTFIVTRLRYGTDLWDMPALFFNLSGINDQSALLWNDNGKIWFFGGGRHFGHVPFKFTTSTDNGASWSELEAPIITGEKGKIAPQPINSAFRDSEGNIYFGSDSQGAQSFLWKSTDNGKTWQHTLGLTGGRHTSFVQLKDGRILGIGGKNSNIDGYMPKFYSSDLGKTWTGKIKTTFAALGSNQRPTIIRLKSGRLFFASDFQQLRIVDSPPPDDITQRGAFVALSDDEGETWHIKKLEMAPPHNGWDGKIIKGRKPQHGYGTVGYCAASQAENGVIHLLTSKGYPSMHFEMNEAWILSDVKDQVNSEPGKVVESSIKNHLEKFPNGNTKISWGSVIGKNGNYYLHGKEKWYYENGRLQYEVNYDLGKKNGSEKYWDRNGKFNWEREYKNDDSSVWTHYWLNGNKKTISHWKGLMAEGMAYSFDINGKLLEQINFKKGKEVTNN